MEPNRISSRKCCDRYTLEKAMIQEHNIKHNFTQFLLLIIASIVKITKALAACPDGKVKSLYNSIPEPGFNSAMVSKNLTGLSMFGKTICLKNCTTIPETAPDASNIKEYRILKESKIIPMMTVVTPDPRW